MKKQKGISLIALIITIIVIIILAAIVIGLALTTPESANRAKFASDMSEVQHAVAVKLADNNNQYITNPDTVNLNSGFTRVPVNGAPESFDGFAPQEGETGTIGYLVNLDTIKLERLSIGQGYKDTLVVNFGSTDAFVYDDEGEVFYAKGYREKNYVYYNIIDVETGGKPSQNPSENPSDNPSDDPSDDPGGAPILSADNPVFLYGANTPAISSGMLKVRWNESGALIDENNSAFDDDVWYDYIAQTKDTARGVGRSWN
jgi:type II secretory pathway pseudopilin PulG